MARAVLVAAPLSVLTAFNHTDLHNSQASR
jgi:hypothetical protein